MYIPCISHGSISLRETIFMVVVLLNLSVICNTDNTTSAPMLLSFDAQYTYHDVFAVWHTESSTSSNVAECISQNLFLSDIFFFFFFECHEKCPDLVFTYLSTLSIQRYKNGNILWERLTLNVIHEEGSFILKENSQLLLVH